MPVFLRKVTISTRVFDNHLDVVNKFIREEFDVEQ